VVASVLAAAARLARPTALLTDVAGIKREVVAEVTRELSALPGAAARFVGGHPMAGSERSGPRAGDAALFSAATWVLTPTDITSDAALARASDLARGLGARVLVLAPDEHDTIVGLVSHLPQLIASVLADVAAEAVGAERDAVMAVAGPGFRDTTRIAASDPGLWLDIVEGNHAAIVPALDAFAERFVEVREAVRTHDRERLGTILRRASESRRRLVPKGSDEPTTDLVVPLRDRPGEISRIAGALGSAGINIEDLSMRHASAADRGSLLLRVREDAAERAVAVLAAADVSGVTVEVEGHPSIGPGSGA
jgi:prephenate dehydrogenase